MQHCNMTIVMSPRRGRNDGLVLEARPRYPAFETPRE
jgi:hypothetical protein